MRLISQDGMIDVPYEQAIIEYEACERNGEEVFHIIFARTTRNTFPIARYSTEAKAIKVMEMLREKYAKIELFKSVYQKGLLTELNKELGFDEMQNTLTSIFQFPKDEEVEVQE